MASTLLLIRRSRPTITKHIFKGGRYSNHHSRLFLNPSFSTFAGDEDQVGPCPFTAELKTNVSKLSKASSISERHALTVAIRKTISNAPEPNTEFEGLDGKLTSEQPIYLCLNSKIERLNELHDRIIGYVHEDQENSIDKTTATDEDEDALSDELATSTPILPRTLTFGYTPFESVAALLNLLEDRYGLGAPSSPPLGSWLDLGSGDGHPTLSAALLRNWKSCCGIEVKSSLYKKSLKLKGLYEHWQASSQSKRVEEDDIYGFNKIITSEEAADSNENYEYLSSGQSPMFFANTDMRSCFYKRNLVDGTLKDNNLTELKDVSLVFLHATCFDDATMLEVAALAEQLQPGALIASVTKAVPSKYLQTLERRSLPFSWGVGTLHIQRRLEEVHVLNDTIPTDAIAMRQSRDMDKNHKEESMKKLILSHGGERVNIPAATELRHALASHTIDTIDLNLNQMHQSSCLDLLVDQINTSLSLLNEKYIGHSSKNNAGTSIVEVGEDSLRVLDLMIEAACTIAQSTSNHEMNARSVIDSGYMAHYKGFLENGITGMLRTTPSMVLDLQNKSSHTSFDNKMYSKLLGVWASSCLVSAALSAHYGCTERMLTSGVVHALVDLVNEKNYDGSSEEIKKVGYGVPFAIRGAAAAALCNAAVNVHVAHELKEVLHFDLDLKELIEEARQQEGGNESFCESANACIESIERYAPIYNSRP